MYTNLTRDLRNEEAAHHGRQGRRRSSIVAEARSARAANREATANKTRILALGGELRRASVVVQGLFSDVDAQSAPKRPKGVTARESSLRSAGPDGHVAPHDRNDSGHLAFDIDTVVGGGRGRTEQHVAGSSLGAGAAKLREEIR